MISTHGTLGPVRDRDPDAFAAATGTDRAAIAFWSLCYPSGTGRVAGVLATRGVSCDLIAAVLDEARSWGHAARAAAEAAAATNPAAPVEHAEGWLRGENPHIATGAAGNPAFFTIAAHLRDRLDPHIAARICANPAATADYLSVYWPDSVRYAAANPNLAQHDIRSMLLRYWSGNHSGAVEVYSNASLSGNALRRGLGDSIELVRLAATANPTATDAQLRAQQGDTHAVASLARAILERRAYRAAPLDTPLDYIATLDASRVDPALIAAAADLDEITHAAAASMLASGFAGTMAELIGVAAGIAGR